MEPKNLLFILSDQHNREFAGCYGSDLAQTPHLDALAARGTRFDNAYTPCPICVPARASLATGRYVHQLRYWDHAHPYTGDPPGWGQRLMHAGAEVTAIGKLHYRNATDPTGWSEQIDTLHVVDGLGDLRGSIRSEKGERLSAAKFAAEAGRGESPYTRYDARTADHAVQWLHRRGQSSDDRPWVLFLGFVLPHFPLVAPPEFYDLYDEVPWPRMYGEEERPDHPVIRDMMQIMAYDRYFDAERIQVARRAYCGMVTMLDHCIGRALHALEEAGLADSTRVVYTSDHGECLGNRGMWGKCNMYEESAAVPLIIAGPELPEGKAVDTPVNLVDCYQTVLDNAGLNLTEEEQFDMPGHSLFGIANGDPPRRTILSEYHAAGSVTGFYMIRDGRWKYVHYVGYDPQLFDLVADPHETIDLGTSPDHADVVAQCETKLRAVVDPEAADENAFADQAALIERHGGPDAVRARGDYGYTPAPGEPVRFYSN